MWRTYDEFGTLQYSFIESLEAMHAYYVARAIGGLLFLIGGVIGFYNIYKTISTSGAEARIGDQPIAASRAAE
jgi:cytochrome c oxidase cbb3-type subunit 1